MEDDVENFEDGSTDMEATEIRSAEMNDSEALFPNGIPFLDQDKVGCVFCKDDLHWPFEKITAFNRENFEEKICNGEILELIRNGYFTKHEVMTRLNAYLCDLMFCSFDPNFLARISATLIESLNVRSHGIFCLLISKIPNWFETLGGKIAVTYGKDAERKKVDFVQSTPISDVCIQSNIKHTLMVLTNCTSKEMNMDLRLKTRPYDSLDKLLYTLFIMAQDPIVVNSCLSASIKECARSIIELYPILELEKAEFERIYLLVEKMYDYWVPVESMKRFPYEMVCYLIERIIPESEKGILFGDAMTIFALMTMIEVEPVNLIKPTIEELNTLCLNYKEQLCALSCHELYSVFKLLHYCVRHKNSLSDTEKMHLKMLLQFINAVHQKTSPSDKELTIKTMAKGLIRSINHQWEIKIDGVSSQIAPMLV